ncbi:MAG TPA: DNA polymerase III subunit delta [Polyangia bacterium]|nr:DNA polymerase III subunit delta [Polyangia bacterium]
MDILQLIERLDERTVEPVYLVHGAERFLIDEFLGRLRALVLEGPMAELNFRRLRAGGISAAEIAAEARAVPMLSSRRLLVIEEGERLLAADLEVLDPCFERPAPETCLVLIAAKLDLRRGPISRANKRGQVHKAEPLGDKDVPGFVGQRARLRGVRLAPEAAAAIAAAVGTDCATLDDAVERAGLYAGPEREVTAADVREVISPVRQHSVFELVDAIGGRQPDRALALVAELLDRREEPLKLVGLLARHVRQLLQARIRLHAAGGTLDPGALASELGAHPFVARKLLAQCRSFRGVELEHALARLARTDLELKSSRRPASLVLEQAVTDLSLGG